MEELEMLYHKQTNTTWSNDKNWWERHGEERLKYASIEIDIDNVFEMKRHMESEGYHLVLNKDNPYNYLNEKF
jgi:hypothetical protein